jgi:DNA repair protein RadC
MRMASLTSSDSSPSKRGQRIKAPHEIAPSLVPKAQKNRAVVSPPAPLLMAKIDDMPEHERAVIDAALTILRLHLRRPGAYAAGVDAAKALAILHYAHHEAEAFGVMFLDSQNGVIAIEELFKGTLTHMTVPPREVVRAALRHNAASVILMHNHPGGSPTAPLADRALTQTLKEALSLVEVRIVDHLIVASDDVMSFAECGLL